MKLRRMITSYWPFTAVLLLTACSSLPLLRMTQTPTVKITQVRSTSQGAGHLTQEEVANEVMRFADEFGSKVVGAVDDFRQRVPTPQARRDAQTWKIGQCSSALVIATGPSPTVNLLDMVVLATLGRMVQEDYWVGKVYGDDARPLLEAHRQLEQEAWKLAAKVLDPPQQQQLRDLIQEWRARNPEQHTVAFVHLSDFAESMGKSPATGKGNPHSVFSLFFVDPLAGLDPAVRSINQTRQLAERSMFYMERIPSLLSWQAELLSYQMALEPEVRQVLSNADQLAKTVEQLPQVIDQQREAAIKQIFAGLFAEENQTRQLVGDLRLTLDAGGDAFSNVNATVKSLDTLVGHFQQSSPNTANANGNAALSKPFDINEYTMSLAQAAATARELNTLLATLDQSLPQVKVIGDDVQARADHMLVHAFWLGIVLIVVLLVGSVIAASVYRFLTHRRSAG